ncbi:MAG: UvrD-helicase domain-containing protein, partial [Patescibacteria group bacterium]
SRDSAGNKSELFGIMSTMERILQGLNDKQIEAVRATQGPVLVISGPGSGKTRCLTHRIAYLMANGIPGEQILAVTFTNKAANEIKERVHKLLHSANSVGGPIIGTFHSLGLRILRREIGLLGYGRNFVILDTNDQLAVVKRMLAAKELDSKKFTPNAILNAISKLKTELIFPESYNPPDLPAQAGFYQQIVAQIYNSYQQELQKMNGLDFDDLIALPVKIFRNHPDILQKYQNAWKYIMVDEYQDTSHDQYTLITLLARAHKNLFCIGDDAQSIYMFREADIRNILNFQKDYPDGKVILLEQNYRSTKNILAAAQNVISHNKAQFPKSLWTENIAGEKIHVQETVNERDEANFIVAQIQGMMDAGRPMKDFTVLYRTHAQSRALEEALIFNGFPYQIIGGIKFYERKEVKDILSYLRFLNNPKDSVSLDRIYNVPTRGIGKTTIDKVVAREAGDRIEAIQKLAAEKKSKPLLEFALLISELRENLQGQKVSTVMKTIVKKIGYENYLINLKGDAYENAEERIENLKELFTVARKYDDMGSEGISKFLEDVALLQETDKLKDDEQRVTLMTMHSSKGLEFPVVFIIGMEEGLFPHNRSLFEPAELEEERRLCYVALTRAQQRLFLTYAKWRNIFGSTQANLPSRFLGEMPQELLEHKRYDFGADEDDKIIIEY